MSASEVDIANFSLAHLGVSITISALTDRSKEARACNLWYTQCRDEVLQSFAWPFATVPGETLALVTDFTTVAGAEWRYAYAYPDTALSIRRAVYGSTRNPTVETAVKHRIVRNSSGGKLLYLDQDAATIEYVQQVTDPGEFSPLFVAALSYLLASRICASVTSENTLQKQGLMEAKYAEMLGKAAMAAIAEEAPDVEPDAGFITARE